VQALEDDLNTPQALAELNAHSRRLAQCEDDDELRRAAGQFLATGELLGLLQDDPEAWFKGETGDDAAIDALVEARQQARRDRDFTRADAIRAQLTDLGITLEDSADGTRWRRE
jgi:cysteinyl-tRNA synthetase